MKKNVKTLRLYDFSRFRSLKSSHKYRLSSKLPKNADTHLGICIFYL